MQWGEMMGLQTVVLPLAQVVSEGLRNSLGSGSKSRTIPTAPEYSNSNKVPEMKTSP